MPSALLSLFFCWVPFELDYLSVITTERGRLLSTLAILAIAAPSPSLVCPTSRRGFTYRSAALRISREASCRTSCAWIRHP